jgi:uncharacterized protein DUF1592/uncharacterized protein DUF1588/uncharacterized protein DUF1595/uncharacterized protein DUF1587/uncharacterized protein DUF1585
VVRWATVLGCAALACQGTIGARPDSPAGGSVAPPGAMAPGSPGRVTLRRLNNLEYDNTIRDLIGLDLKPSRAFGFTADEFGEGFDNNADVLTLAPVDGENYLRATREVAARALDPAIRARIMICDVAKVSEATCGPQIIEAFARRAFRRPVTADELAPYVGLIALARSNGDDFERGVRLAIQAMLMAPDFLFRVEEDPAPGVVHPLGEYELASRLSYFLWSSMPDDALFAKAADRALGKPEEIVAQVRRMLADPRASALGTNLVHQWLQTSELEKKAPDKRLFPGFDEPLRQAMQQEVELLFAEVFRGKASVTDLLAADYVHVNRRLAEHYGLAGAAAVSATEFQRLAVTDGRRGGILRQASFLTLTSKNDVQSPVVRGKWVLDRVLCAPPASPPPNVPTFNPADKTTTEGQAPGTVRQKLEAVHHKRGPECRACHTVMDPLGFAFEHYDAIGAWRATENGLPVDATGTMPGTGAPFDGAGDLVELLVKDPRFAACLARKVFTYALGRGMRDADRPVVEDVAAQLVAGGYHFPQLLELVATSRLATMREGEP